VLLSPAGTALSLTFCGIHNRGKCLLPLGHEAAEESGELANRIAMVVFFEDANGFLTPKQSLDWVTFLVRLKEKPLRCLYR